MADILRSHWANYSKWQYNFAQELEDLKPTQEAERSRAEAGLAARGFERGTTSWDLAMGEVSKRQTKEVAEIEQAREDISTGATRSLLMDPFFREGFGREHSRYWKEAASVAGTGHQYGRGPGETRYSEHATRAVAAGEEYEVTTPYGAEPIFRYRTELLGDYSQEQYESARAAVENAPTMESYYTEMYGEYEPPPEDVAAKAETESFRAARAATSVRSYKLPVQVQGAAGGGAAGNIFTMTPEALATTQQMEEGEEGGWLA